MRFALLTGVAAASLIGVAGAQAQAIYDTDVVAPAPGYIATAPGYVYTAPAPSYVVADPGPAVIAEPPLAITPPAQVLVAPQPQVVQEQVVAAPREQLVRERIIRERIASPRNRRSPRPASVGCANGSCARWSPHRPAWWSHRARRWLSHRVVPVSSPPVSRPSADASSISTASSAAIEA